MDLAEYFTPFSEYFDFVSPSVLIPAAIGGTARSPPGPMGGAEGGPPASLKPMAKQNQNIQKKVQNTLPNPYSAKNNVSIHMIETFMPQPCRVLNKVRDYNCFLSSCTYNLPQFRINIKTQDQFV